MDNIDKNFIGKQVVAICEARKVGFREFAAELNLPYQTIMNYSRGRSYPKLDFIYLLFGLGINLHWFLTGEGNMYRATSEQNASTVQQQINGKDANNVVAGNTVNNGNLVATVVNNEGQGREMRLCQFVHEFLINADDDDCLWFELQLSRCFPEYKAWKQENSG